MAQRGWIVQGDAVPIVVVSGAPEHVEPMRAFVPDASDQYGPGFQRCPSDGIRLRGGHSKLDPRLAKVNIRLPDGHLHFSWWSHD